MKSSMIKNIILLGFFILTACGKSFKANETSANSSVSGSSVQQPNPLPTPSPGLPPVNNSVTWTTNPPVVANFIYASDKLLQFSLKPSTASVQCFYSVSGSSAKIAKACANNQLLADIEGTVTYFVEGDNASAKFSNSVVVKLDKTIPVVTVSAAQISADGQTFTYTVSANEPVSYYYYKRDGGAASANQLTGTFNVVISDYLPHSLVFSAADYAGNIGNSASVNLQRVQPSLPPESAQNPRLAGVLLNRSGNDASGQSGNGSTISWDGRLMIRTGASWLASVFHPQQVTVAGGLTHDVDLTNAYSEPVPLIHHEFFPGTTDGYGAYDTAMYVKMLYRILLLREPAASEVKFWQNLLDTHQQTPAQVLQGFETSNEYRGILAANPAHAFHPKIIPFTKFTELNALALAPYYTDRAFLLDCYQNILSVGQPDDPGFAYWLTELREGRQNRSSIPAAFASTFGGDPAQLPNKFKNYARLASSENPYPSDNRGEYSPNGSFKTYDVLLYTQVYKLFQYPGGVAPLFGRNPDLEMLPQDTIGVMRARFIISNPDTDAADLVGYYFMNDFTPLHEAGGAYVHGIEPTLTADGLLMVYNANVPDGVLKYTHTEDPLNPDAWSMSHNLTTLYTEKDNLIHGIKIGERYPLAKQPIKTPAGVDYLPQDGIKGAYPWISWEGTEVYFTSLVASNVNPAVNARRAGASVVGQWTGNAVRLLDGFLNTGLYAYDKIVLFAVGIGSTSSFWNPYKNISNPKLPFLYERPSVMINGFNDNTYNDISFKEFVDGRYIIAWPMGEMLNKIPYNSDPYVGLVDFRKTPDLSGHFNSGTLGVGAWFQSEFGLGNQNDRYAGYKGQAIRFKSEGMVSVANQTDFQKLASFTVEMFVLLEQPGSFKLAQFGGAANVFSLEYVGGKIYANLATSSNYVLDSGAAVILPSTWTHVAATYDHIGGTFKLYINGKMVSQALTTSEALPIPFGSVFRVGPAGPVTNGLEVMRLDEVRLSMVSRSATEIADAAHLPYSQRFDFSVNFPARVSKSDLKIPDELMLSTRKAQLGQILFNDKRLSANNSTSCASCHGDSNLSDPRQFSVGLNGNALLRHSPAIFNRAITGNQMWDAKFSSLHAQILGPLTNPNEMNLTSAQIVSRLSSNSNYARVFNSLYGAPPNLNNVQQALSSFLDLQMTDNTSPADQFEQNGTGLSMAQQRGRNLFFGQARCSSCHSGVNYTDDLTHNVGIFQDSPDLGLQGISGRSSDLRYFKTPSLRNVAQTSPYLHDGRFTTLEQVIAQYNRGGLTDASRSNEIKALNLNSAQQADLAEYLRALTSPVRSLLPINLNPANTIEQLGPGL